MEPVRNSYRTVLADVPWRFQNFTDTAHGAASAHFVGMDVQQLSSIPVRMWAAEDSYLFFWATWPKLADAVDVVRAWGFEVLTGFPWIKTLPNGEPRLGIGFWAQHCSEFLIIARRGKPSRKSKGDPVMGLLVGENPVFYAPRGKHSEKPVGIYDYIEERCDGPYLELFATKHRAGWDSWGHKTGYELGAFGVRSIIQPAARVDVV